MNRQTFKLEMSGCQYITRNGLGSFFDALREAKKELNIVFRNEIKGLNTNPEYIMFKRKCEATNKSFNRHYAEFEAMRQFLVEGRR